MFHPRAASDNAAQQLSSSTFSQLDTAHWTAADCAMVEFLDPSLVHAGGLLSPGESTGSQAAEMFCFPAHPAQRKHECDYE